MNDPIGVYRTTEGWAAYNRTGLGVAGERG
jgi:hypothetical protein